MTWKVRRLARTYDHCYKTMALRFFYRPRGKLGLVQVSTPGDYLATHTPLGRADLPTASYTEMMEWRPDARPAALSRRC